MSEFKDIHVRIAFKTLILRTAVLLQANPAGRLQSSLVRQFAQQEARSLLTRTKPKRGVEHPETVCYVIKAVEDNNAEEKIVGTLDLKLPACASGCHPHEVPEVGHSSWRSPFLACEPPVQIMHVPESFKSMHSACLPMHSQQSRPASVS